MSAPCPSVEQLERLIDDRLEAAEDAALARHVESCAPCQARLERLFAGGPSSPSPAPPNPEMADALLIRLKKRGRRDDETAEFTGKQPLADRPSNRAAALPEVPGYEVLSEIGRGGMGVIYKARRLRLGRVVALKMLLAGARAGSAELRRFHIEASAVARLAHPGIVGVYDVGEYDGLPYLSLELVEGGSLKQLLAGIPQQPRASARLVEQLARAVQHAHEAGIVHRDLKPGNVLLARDGDAPAEPGRRGSAGASPSLGIPKITDFGLAKLLTEGPSDGPTQSGAVVGTPGYMAPEQAAGNQRQVGPAVDVYALGAILYECLTGRPPFQAATPLETLLQVMHDEPVSIGSLQPRVPRDLATIAMRCLEKAPARRYARALDLAEDLRRFQAQEPILARRPSSWYRATRFVRRHKALAAGVAVSLAAMLVGTIVSVLFALGENRQRRLADDNAHHMEEAQRQAQWEAYEARLAVAQARLDGHSLREAAEQLDKAPEDLRRWEWFHLHSRLDDSGAVVGEPEPRPDFPVLLPASGHVVLASRDHDLVQLSLWDADNHRLNDLGVGQVLSVASSWTGSLVFVQRPDGALASFDDAGRPGPLFDLHGPFPVFDAALSADGKQLALSWKTATEKTCALALFDPATGALLSPLPTQQRDVIYRLAFSADGKRLAAAADDNNLRLWDVPERRCVAAWDASKNRGFWYVGFSPDGQRILSAGSDETCCEWEAPSGRLLEVRHGAERRSNTAALSPDGNWLAAGGKDGVLRILSARSGEPVAEFQGHTDGIRRVAFSPDCRSIWTAGADGTARCWDLAPAGDPRVLRHETYVYSVAYSPDGRWFASAGWHSDRYSDPSTIHLWDAASGQPIALLHGAAGWVASLAITPDGKRFASVEEGGSVRLWDSADGRGRKLPMAVRGPPSSGVTRISISPDGRLLAVPDDRQVRLWDLQSDKEEAALAVSLTRVRIAVFSPDGARLAVAGNEPEVQIVGVPKGDVLAVLRGHTDRVQAVAFSPDGSRIVTGGEDRSVRLWDAATGKLQTVLGGAKGGHTDTVFAAAFHPDGTRIATGGRDRAIRIWDAATGEELVRLAGHTDYVFALAFSPDGATLVSGSGDGTVRLWDTAPLRERYNARQELEALRPEADALVDRLFHQGYDADEVVRRLRSDTDRSEPLRRAAWHAVLRRAEADE